MVREVNPTGNQSWESVKERRDEIEKLISAERQEEKMGQKREFNEKIWAQIQQNFQHYIEDLKRHKKD